MAISSWLLSLLPLCIPVVVWVMLNRRDRAVERPLKVSEESNSNEDELPRLVPTVREFSAGGAIKASAIGQGNIFVQDILLGHHECVLFAYCEELHGRAKPWGDVLDAGTGSHSLGWLGSLNRSSLTAVTGDPHMMSEMQRQFTGKLQDRDELVIGNWRDEDFLKGRQFDVIIADYLLGALEGFAPYHQHSLLERLQRHLRPGGELYFVGTEPLPERVSSAAGQLVSDVARTRDAAILLGNDRRRPYREYPQWWVLQHVPDSWRLVGSGAFPIVYSVRTVLRQLTVARRKLPLMSAGARAGMAAYCDELESRIAATDWRGVRLGEDYVCAFQKPKKEATLLLDLE